MSYWVYTDTLRETQPTQHNKYVQQNKDEKNDLSIISHVDFRLKQLTSFYFVATLYFKINSHIL